MLPYDLDEEPTRMRHSDVDIHVVLDVLPHLPVRFYTKDLSEHPAVIRAHTSLVGERNYHAVFGSFLSANGASLGLRLVEHDTSGRGAIWEQIPSVTLPPTSAPTPDADARDPISAPELPAVHLICPKCKTEQVYTFATPTGVARLSCPRCRSEFTHHAVKIRAKRSRGDRSHNRREFSVRVIYASGDERLVEFTNAAYADFELRSGDMVSLSYLGDSLRIVQNYTVGQYYLVSSPWCFIATYAYGENDSRVFALRRLRDETLLPNRVGRVVIKLYCRLSPVLVRKGGGSRAFRGMSRLLLGAVICLHQVLRPARRKSDC